MAELNKKQYKFLRRLAYWFNGCSLKSKKYTPFVQDLIDNDYLIECGNLLKLTLKGWEEVNSND